MGGGDWRRGEQAIHSAEKLAEQVLLHSSAMDLQRHYRVETMGPLLTGSVCSFIFFLSFIFDTKQRRPPYIVLAVLNLAM